MLLEATPQEESYNWRLDQFKTNKKAVPDAYRV